MSFHAVSSLRKCGKINTTSTGGDVYRNCGLCTPDRVIILLISSTYKVPLMLGARESIVTLIPTQHRR